MSVSKEVLESVLKEEFTKANDRASKMHKYAKSFALDPGLLYKSFRREEDISRALARQISNLASRIEELTGLRLGLGRTEGKTRTPQN